MKKIKSLKVKTRLILGFGFLILLMLIISVMCISGIRALRAENNVLIEKTIANNNYLWEIRRNLLSEQRYELMALIESDQARIDEHLDMAQQEIDKTAALFEQYKGNAQVDESKIERLEAYFDEQAAPRTEMMDLLRSGAEEKMARAYEIFEKEYKPLVDEQAEVVFDITNDQVALAEEEARKAEMIYRAALAVPISILIIAIIVCIYVTKKLIKRIVVPLTEIEQATHALSQGDFTSQITYDSADEFGNTCRSMQSSFTKLKEIFSEISTVLGALSRDDLTARVSSEFPGEMQGIVVSIDKLVDSLNKTMREIQEAAGQINASAGQVSSGAQALAQGTTEQASSVEELSARITEVSNQVKMNSENAGTASALATASGEVAQSTLENMNEMTSAMQEISLAAENIKKVIKVIDDIAFQTNILSLNAAVEAARAGSAGKGFAVVADEVRNLAGKSSEAVKSTTSLIESALDAVSHGEEIAERTHTAFEKLAEQVQKVVSTIGEISDASREQADAIQEITSGVDQISSVIQTNSATSQESAAASEELSGQANMLNSLVNRFRLSQSQNQSDIEKMADTNSSTEIKY